jgi:cystathionine beta-lyase/cystathionine gamma-synthase
MKVTTPSVDTTAVHAGEPTPRFLGASTFPIFQAAVYEFRGAEGETLRYPRYGNSPNHDVLSAKLAALEGGEDAIVAASGMAVISSAFLATLGQSGHLLVQRGAYGGVSAFLSEHFRALGFTFTEIDATAPATWGDAIRPNTRAIYVEAMSNPLVAVPELGAVVTFAKERGIASVIDNTFASPVLFRAAEFGFDLSLHSATKYLNGHDDVVAGCAIGRRELVAKVRDVLKLFGGALDPHACWLVHRGTKTIGLRVPRQCDNALALARSLERNPAVANVRYPGLESSADFARAKRYFGGRGGGVFAFELKGGVEAARKFLGRLTIPLIGPSLGGVETLVSMPAFVSHRDVPREQREAAGLRDGAIRVSVGIEAADDLVADFDQALRD